MSHKVKVIDIKNRTHYVFSVITNIENFDPNNIKIDENSYKDILIHFIGYVAFIVLCIDNIQTFIKKYRVLDLSLYKPYIL